MPKYKLADDVEVIARELIEDHHPHLDDEAVSIGFVFKEGDVGKKQMEQEEGQIPKVAKGHLVKSFYKRLTGHDFVIEVDEKLWKLIDPDLHKPIIDAELHRFGVNEKGPHLIDAPIVLFPGMLKRYGEWTPDLKKMGSQLRQLKLFSKPDAPRKSRQSKPPKESSAAAQYEGRTHSDRSDGLSHID